MNAIVNRVAGVGKTVAVSDDDLPLFEDQEPPDLGFCPTCGLRTSAKKPHGAEDCSAARIFREFARASFRRVAWPAEESRGAVERPPAAP